MKKNIFKYLGLALLLTLGADQAIAQVGIGTTDPDASSSLDILSTNSGLLIPRIALSATGLETPVTSPANSLLVYNTATANDVVPGFYYWSQSENKWIALAGITANNGLTKTGQNVQLGGALIKPTTITASATNTLAIAGLVNQTGTNLNNVDGLMTVEANGTVRKVYPVYSTSAAQNTLKKWTDGKTVYERVGAVTLASATNVINLSGIVPSGAKLLGIRLIGRTKSSISTNIVEYNNTSFVLVLGTSGAQTILHPAGTYDVIVEYVAP